MSSAKITLPHECPKYGNVARNETELRDKFGLTTMTDKDMNPYIEKAARK